MSKTTFILLGITYYIISVIIIIIVLNKINKKEKKKYLEEINNLENEVSNVRLEMEKEEYSTDYIKLKEMQDCIDNKNTMIEEKMIMWEELGEELRKYTK